MRSNIAIGEDGMVELDINGKYNKIYGLRSTTSTNSTNLKSKKIIEFAKSQSGSDFIPFDFRR